MVVFSRKIVEILYEFNEMCMIAHSANDIECILEFWETVAPVWACCWFL